MRAGKIALIFWIIILTNAFSARAQAPTENALLWEIKTPGATKSSYLFGTIHLICKSDFTLSDSLKSALARTEQVALEIDMDDPNMMMTMMKSMNMQGGESLKRLVSEPEYTKINQFFKDSVGIGLQMLDKAKPFVLIGPLFNAVLKCQAESYEMALVNLAKKQQSEVIGIETLEEQMGIFDSIPYKDQAKMIITVIDSMSQARKEFNEMVNLYKKQDINGLYEKSISSDFGMEKNGDALLFNRNKNWISRIKNIAAQKPTFFAVGAAHLGGDKGVVSLLRQNGFQVRAIKAP